MLEKQAIEAEDARVRVAAAEAARDRAAQEATRATAMLQHLEGRINEASQLGGGKGGGGAYTGYRI